MDIILYSCYEGGTLSSPTCDYALLQSFLGKEGVVCMLSAAILSGCRDSILSLLFLPGLCPLFCNLSLRGVIYVTHGKPKRHLCEPIPNSFLLVLPFTPFLPHPDRATIHHPSERHPLPLPLQPFHPSSHSTHRFSLYPSISRHSCHQVAPIEFPCLFL